jgi:hypothetical protein
MLVMKHKQIATFLMFGTLTSFSANANLIANPSFESTPLVDSIAFPDWNIAAQTWDIVKTKGAGHSWAVFSIIPGWQNFYGNGVELHASGTIKTTNLSPVNAVDGNNYIELDSHFNSSNPGNSNYGISQVISGLTTGAYYDLSFWYRARTTQANDNILNVYWSNAVAALTQGDYIARYDYNNLDNNHEQWVKYTLRLQATTSDMKLGFGGAGSASWGMVETFNGNGKGATLDGLNLVAVSAPANVGILFFGLLALALRQRRRKSDSL